MWRNLCGYIELNVTGIGEALSFESDARGSGSYQESARLELRPN